MGKFIDLTGRNYGRWLVIERSKTINKSIFWKCKCTCGAIKDVDGNRLRSGNSQSCGCYAYEMTSKRSKKYNTYDFKNEYVIGCTSKGEEFYFDLEDYDSIKDYCWLINKDGYVIARELGENKIIYMHRHIMSFYKNIDLFEIDHIKENSRNNNTKSNLRKVMRTQNSANKGLYTTNTSGVTGVVWEKRRGRWKAQIGVNGKNIFLGEFKNKEDAIKARKDAEDKYFGEFSFKNSQEIN